MGSEIKNNTVEKIFSKFHIKHFTTQNEDIKANIVEKVIRTIKTKLYRFFERKRSYRFVDHLLDIVQLQSHSSLFIELPFPS